MNSKKGKRTITNTMIASAVILLNKGLSQTQVCEKLKMSNGTISAIKQERARILAEANNGNIVRATPIVDDTSAIKWTQRRNNYTNDIKEALVNTNMLPGKVVTKEAIKSKIQVAPKVVAKKTVAKIEPVAETARRHEVFRERIAERHTKVEAKSVLTIKFNETKLFVDLNKIAEINISDNNITITSK